MLFADLVAQVAQRHLHDAVGVPRFDPSASLCDGTPKRITAGTPSVGQLAPPPCAGSPRVLDDAGQRGDRLGLVDALPHEERRHQVVDREAGLGHEPAEGRRGAQAAGRCSGNATEAMLGPGGRRAQAGPPARSATAAASDARVTASSEVTTRSAVPTSWPTVSGPGQAICVQPGRDGAEATPVAESSKATDHSGRAQPPARGEERLRVGLALRDPVDRRHGQEVRQQAELLEHALDPARVGVGGDGQRDVGVAGRGDERSDARAEHERGKELVVVRGLAARDAAGSAPASSASSVTQLGDHAWPTTCDQRSMG